MMKKKLFFASGKSRKFGQDYQFLSFADASKQVPVTQNEFEFDTNKIGIFITLKERCYEIRYIFTKEIVKNIVFLLSK